jgi:hypothetical protein
MATNTTEAGCGCMALGLLLIMASLFLTLLGGCATTTRLDIRETYPDGATFALSDRARGDATTSRQVEYTGDGWRLAVNSDADIESPAQLALAEGTAVLLSELPDILGDILPLIQFASSVPGTQAPGVLRGIIESVVRSRLESVVRDAVSAR